MKQKKDLVMLYAAMAGYAVFVLPAVLLLLILFAPADRTERWVDTPYPEGTQIIQEVGTRRRWLREGGDAVIVAQIPPEAAEKFGEEMQWGLWSAPPSRRLREVMADVEGVSEVLDSERLLWKYYVITDHVVEGPHKEYCAEAYDPETGIYCYLERRK